MAEKNNLVLTIVLVAGALLLFNGGVIGQGVSGNAVAARSCAKEGSSLCVYGDVYKCLGGQLVHQDTCDKNEQCITEQIGGQTTNPTVGYCKPSHVANQI